MELFETITTRRSIRAYTDKPVTDDSLRRILAAGMMAPSAGNEQPWEFIIIRERNTLRAISKAHPHADMAQYAQAVLIACGDMDRVTHGEFWVQDLAAATQNMLLAAHALGLGSVWVGVHPRVKRVAEIRKVVPMPERIVPFALLPVGYPGEEKASQDRFSTSRVHMEKW
ncbi:MAG: nitroreductase family protein [Bacteroidota bacterium]